MKRLILVVVAVFVVVGLASALYAQEDVEKFKKELFKKISEKLETAKKKMLDDISKTLDEEIKKALAKKGDDDDDDEEEDEEELTLMDAQQLFQESLRQHEAEEYEDAIKGFKRIFKAFPDHNLGYTAAYNIACGYALLGKTKKALDWLEKSVEHGFNNFRHMENDPDLDSLRDEERYKKIIEEGGEGEEE
jgi:tetratricopeptide (TPR) repeat protein